MKRGLRLERLETREMLSGLAVTSLTQTPTQVPGGGLVGSPIPKAPPAPAPLQGTVLSAQLSDPANPTATGTMTYMTGTVNGVTVTQLLINVGGTAASSTLNVEIGSTVVGTLTTDANGNGALVLTTNPQNPNDQPLPTNFPSSISAGTAVSVGTLAGSLAAQTSTPPTPAPPPAPPSAPAPPVAVQGTVLSAQLSDPANAAASGMMTYMSGTVNGTASTLLIVGVHDTAANSTLSVSIGSVVVGTVTTDANGNGNLVLTSNPQNPNDQPLPSNFPTSITAGTAVSVGTLDGTLATQTNPSPTPPPAPAPVQSTVLSAPLGDPANPAASGMVVYMTSTANNVTSTQLIVGVRGAAANSPLSLIIGGVTVGAVMTDANGNGNLVLTSNPQKPGDQPLPPNFPTSVAAGTPVSVGTLDGSLAAPPTTPPTTPPPPAQGIVILGAQLSDPANAAATGMVTFMTGSVNGVTSTQLIVGVSGAAASSTLSVSIGSTVVGTLTTDANGNGNLVLSNNPKNPGDQPLPANFPTSIPVGTAVSAGTLSGSLNPLPTPPPPPPPQQ